jgi:methylase of polypeptide subunit release factors
MTRGGILAVILRSLSPWVALLTRNRYGMWVLFRIVARPARRCAGWDTATVALFRSMAKVVCHGLTVVDLGTGEAAILAIRLRRLGALRVIGVDPDKDAIRRARETYEANGGRNGSFVCGTSECLRARSFHLVVCNPPFVSHGFLCTSQVALRSRIMWDGGPSGCEVAVAILRDALRVVTRGGIVVFGVSNISNPRLAVRMVECGAEVGAIALENANQWLGTSVVWLSFREEQLGWSQRSPLR